MTRNEHHLAYERVSYALLMQTGNVSFEIPQSIFNLDTFDKILQVCLVRFDKHKGSKQFLYAFKIRSIEQSKHRFRSGFF